MTTPFLNAWRLNPRAARVSHFAQVNIMYKSFLAFAEELVLVVSSEAMDATGCADAGGGGFFRSVACARVVRRM